MIGIDKQVHIIHCYEVPVGDSNKKEIINKIESKCIDKPLHLNQMQTIVEGLIERYPARLPKLISLLPDAVNCVEMIINEEGRFTKPLNKIATQIAREILGADKVTGRIPDTKDFVLDVKGTVFITDNWGIS